MLEDRERQRSTCFHHKAEAMSGPMDQHVFTREPPPPLVTHTDNATPPRHSIIVCTVARAAIFQGVVYL